MHGLQAVAHVGQRAVHDGRQRVGQIALFERVLEIDRARWPSGPGRIGLSLMASGLARAARPGKTRVVDAVRSPQTRGLATCGLLSRRLARIFPLRFLAG